MKVILNVSDWVCAGNEHVRGWPAALVRIQPRLRRLVLAAYLGMAEREWEG